MGKLEGKRPLGSTRCKWMDNIKIDLGGIRWGGMNSICLVQVRK
jgi:hypothetical protein